MHGFQPLIAFAETAKRGSFAAAARDLGCTPSTLAKAVARLEDRLGLRLFHRTTRQLRLSDDGERLFARCQRVLAEMDSLHEEASGARASPRGTLRVDMPVSLGRLVMLPLLARLSLEHPELAIDARLSDLYVDLVKDGIDVAIRAGPLRDSSLVARRFATQELLLVASPAYLARRGRPRSLKDLAAHEAVLFRVPSSGRDRPWHFRHKGRAVELMPPSRFRIDEGDGIVRAAVLGLGMGQIPHYMALEAMQRGDLVEVLSDWRPSPMPLAAVMPSARMVPARVRALLDLLEAHVARVPAPPPR